MNKLVLKWLVFLIPSILIELMCYILAPLVAFFIRSEERSDRVKQFDNQQHTMDRDYLIKPLMWFQTHDNAVDEWWYGAFNRDSYFQFVRESTQEDYDNEIWFRYFCRVMWLWRNCAYGFLYNLFGVIKDPETASIVTEHGIEGSRQFWWKLVEYPNSFSFKAELPIKFTNRHFTVNIGWKSHRGFPRRLYANRIIGVRTYD